MGDTSTMHRDYYVIPLRDVVAFPHSKIPLYVGRKKSIATLQKVVSDSPENPFVLLLTQKESQIDDPSFKDLYEIGTLARIIHLTESPDESLQVLAEGQCRIKVESPMDDTQYLRCKGDELPTIIDDSIALEAARNLVMDGLQKYRKSHKKRLNDAFSSISQVTDIAKMADLLSANLHINVNTKQEILGTESLEKRLLLILTYLKTEIEVSNVEDRILKRIKQNVKRHQDDYVKHIKNQAIRDELGDSNEFDALELRIQNTKLSVEAKKKAEVELRRLKGMNAMSSEAVLLRNYLEWLLDLPWGKKTTIEKNLDAAEAVLNNEHYGLLAVKKRIKEYVAVSNRTGQAHGTVLCLEGPPGVGKTSLGKLIARATKRKFARLALGGVKDEAAIRGHRKTYIGSFPGGILQELKRCGSSNPVFLLDEIDKISADYRGDPQAALLEVLDPQQNENFVDHYIEVPFSLAGCMFICTANSIQNIHPALLDRMAVIHLSGYTEPEKVEITKQHIVPKQKIANGLKEEEFSISEEAVRKLVRQYTREAGVRELDRIICSLMSQSVALIDSHKIDRMQITKANLDKYAGIPKYTFGEISSCSSVGVVTGLAWTETGGDLLAIEAVLVPGKGKVIATGKLGEVMKESVQTAFSFLRSQALIRNLDLTLLETRDIHIHVPEGATPKDGPSAGVGIYLAMLSALSNVKIKNTVAVTGEISLTGRVWRIGGLKEKILAAHRANIQTVMIPESNMKDLEDIPDEVKAALTIIPIVNASEANQYALEGEVGADKQKNSLLETLLKPTVKAEKTPESIHLIPKKK